MAQAEKIVVEKLVNVCPNCKSRRHWFVYSVVGSDGRLERRRCEDCGTEFALWDPGYVVMKKGGGGAGTAEAESTFHPG